MAETNKEIVEDIITRGVANIIPDRGLLEQKLGSGTSLNIYLGIDPTSVHIHLGHAVLLRKLQKLADLGHKVTFLIGDFTALVGDTSDKESERPILTEKEIKANFASYKKQAEKIIDFSKVELKYNSSWLKELTFSDLIRLTQHFSAGDFISRELIKNRLEAGKRVGLHEFLYPVMQGYDSYHLDTDLQLGGTDQTFNMQMGRVLQKDLRQKESFVIASEFLLGTDGRKMSKSWGNAIWLDDEPEDMYGKVMSVNDDLIIPYFKLATAVPLDEVSAINEQLKRDKLQPLEAKKRLALQIVSELHDPEAAKKAAAEFSQIFQKGQLPSNLPQVDLSDQPLSLSTALVEAKLADSNAEAKRLIRSGSVSLDGKKISEINHQLTPTPGLVIKVGKRRFAQIKS